MSGVLVKLPAGGSTPKEGPAGRPAALDIAVADVAALKLLPLPFGVEQGLF